tara:strand:+ start:1490 stop:1702 length:213 start_codon:yes stop_codon:yes gene_type:complete
MTNVIVKSLNFSDMTAEKQKMYEEEKEANLAQDKKEAEERQVQEDLKASAKAKLVAGEALTQEEADTIVL